ncbi:MAG: alpha/beta hydrolase [Alphaproteobacteria bacterium]|nr:alpha/beta hydrolase [Alphaproteobacteria bacterium]MCW5742547.1 alpha/beta hydrolase [Alphaproteobacteria bacterium]
MDGHEFTQLLKAKLGKLALRMPLSWINVATGGAPVMLDGQTLDTRAQWLLKVFERSGHPAFHEMPVAEGRPVFTETMLSLSVPMTPFRTPEIGEVVDRALDGPGGKLPLRIYRPFGLGAQRVPAILWLHGGGWSLGSLDAYDPPCRFLAARAGCVVVAVDYRLAPEHRFPSALEDCLAAWRWLARSAELLGIDATRLVVAGDSTGGTLATVLANEVRHDAVKPALQVLVYPATDLRMDSRSYELFGEGFFLTRKGMEWARANYLGDDQALIDDPRVSPLRAEDLAGSAPALIYTAGFDPLRDEAIAYANRLRAQGVKVVHRNFDSLIHGFVGMSAVVQAAARAMDDIVAGLRHELANLS